MSPEPLSIISIGDSLPYADGAESELLAIISAAEDRRVGSDELADAIRDWPTAYHLAPERAVLLDPVVIKPRDRVLDVGAGSGVNTRLCADRGAAVTAVEGSAARAELIAHRCAGLDGVEVLCGPLECLGEDRREGFDVVLVVGVLEYSGAGHGGGDGPAALLTRVADALSPGGVVVLAIENRLGLKYLLGFPEDHLGQPWVGLEGYRPGEPTTWSRRELAQMLADAGLSAQKWLYPFPDYKLPTAVLAEEIYDQPQAVDLVDQIVGRPTSEEFARPVLVADERAAHRAMLAAGLGPDVANSFLVVAGRDPEAVAGRVDKQALAWRVAPDRRRRWRQQALVVKSDQGLTMRRRLLAEDRESDSGGWLRQVEVSEEPYVEGRNLEQCLLDRAREGDADGIAEHLRTWRAALAARETSIDSVEAPHPYLPEDSSRVLPPVWLDAGPDNFVVTADGLEFVDREWVAAGGVDVRLAVVRGLWKTVSAMLSSRCQLPWPVTWSNDRLVAHLGGLIGEDIDAELLKRWRQAEDDLIRRVYRQSAVRLAELHDAGSRSRMDLLSSPVAPYRRMEHLVLRQQELIAELTGANELSGSHELSGANELSGSHELSGAIELSGSHELTGAIELSGSHELSGANELSGSHELSGANELSGGLAEPQARLAQVEAQLAQSQAELAEARARLDRVAWRERIHNKIARLARGIRKR